MLEIKALREPTAALAAVILNILYKLLTCIIAKLIKFLIPLQILIEYEQPDGLSGK